MKKERGENHANSIERAIRDSESTLEVLVLRDEAYPLESLPAYVPALASVPFHLDQSEDVRHYL